MRTDFLNGGIGFVGNLCLVCIAILGLANGLTCGLIAILKDFRKWFWEARPVPPKSPYRIVIETDDGWPMRTFTLSREEAGLLVRNLERERDRK